MDSSRLPENVPENRISYEDLQGDRDMPDWVILEKS